MVLVIACDGRLRRIDAGLVVLARPGLVDEADDDGGSGFVGEWLEDVVSIAGIGIRDGAEFLRHDDELPTT